MHRVISTGKDVAPWRSCAGGFHFHPPDDQRNSSLLHGARVGFTWAGRVSAELSSRRTSVAIAPFPPEKFAEMAATADASLFTELVSLYQPIVYRWALVFASDADEAEDLTQETFIRAYRRLKQYRGEGSVDAWLYRIVRNVGSERRRVAVRRRLLGRSPIARPERDVYTTDPGARVDRQKVAELIRDYFGELPRVQREIFDLVDLQQYSAGEVAIMTGRSAAAVRASLLKARAVIRRRLLDAYSLRGNIP
jgi:RNA polymerase sigma-70 factor, ECF subfamily